LLRPGIGEFSFFGNSMHSHSRTWQSQNKRNTTLNKLAQNSLLQIIQGAAEHVRTADGSIPTCWQNICDKILVARKHRSSCSGVRRSV